jgi:hypothetical protein
VPYAHVAHRERPYRLTCRGLVGGSTRAADAVNRRAKLAPARILHRPERRRWEGSRRRGSGM